MKFCCECDVVITQRCYKCIYCINHAHEACAEKSGRVNSNLQYFCYEHARQFVEGQRRSRSKNQVTFNAHVHENPRGSQEALESEDEENENGVVEDDIENEHIWYRSEDESSDEDEENASENKSSEEEGEFSISSDEEELVNDLQNSRISRNTSSIHSQSEVTPLRSSRSKSHSPIRSNARNVRSENKKKAVESVECQACKRNLIAESKEHLICKTCKRSFHLNCAHVKVPSNCPWFECILCVNKEKQKRLQNPNEDYNLSVFGTYVRVPKKNTVPVEPLFGTSTNQPGPSGYQKTAQLTNLNANAREFSSENQIGHSNVPRQPSVSRSFGRENPIRKNDHTSNLNDSDYEYYLRNKNFIRELRVREKSRERLPRRVNVCNDNFERIPRRAPTRHRSVERQNSQPLRNSEQAMLLQLLKRQDEREQRLESAKLPVVKTIGPEWLTFYDAFSKTHKHHSSYSNVARLQEALQCKEIIAMGGSNLFSPNEYLRTIKDINQRLGDPKKLTMQALREILNMKPPRDIADSSDTSALIKFINSVNNFANLQESYGNSASQTDPHTIALLANMLPKGNNRKWHMAVLDIETKRRRVVTIMDLRDHLMSLIPSLERIQYSKDLISLREKDFDKKPKNKFQSNNIAQVHNMESSERPAWLFKCWVCKSDTHILKECQKARSSDGKDLISLGKSQKVCLDCGREKYSGNCSARTKPPTCPKCLNSAHWLTVCPKRKGKKMLQDISSQSVIEDNSTYKVHNTKAKSDINLNTAGLKNSSPIPEQNVTHTDEQNVIRANQANEQPLANVETSNNHQFFRQNQNNRQINQNLYWDNNDSRGNRMFYASQNMHCVPEYVALLNTAGPKFQTANNLLAVVVLKIGNCSESKAILVDCGSTISLIDDEFASNLNLGGYSYPLTLCWSGNQKRVDEYSRIIQVSVQTLSPIPKTFTMHFHTFYQLGIGDQKFVAAEIKARYPYLNDLNLHDYNEIVGVIGIDQVFAFVQLKKFFAPAGDMASNLIGIKGPLGDYVIGSKDPISYVYRSLQANNSTNYQGKLPAYYHQSEISELARYEEIILGEDYYKYDFDDRKDASDTYALELLETHVKRSPNGKNFEAPLLWKDECPELPTQSSFKVAYRRLKIMLKHAESQGKYGEVEKQMRDLLEKNYASEVPPELINKLSNKIFYNPIFFISPPGKRMRMIWDAKAEVEEGKSLNSFLLSGPNLYNEMLKILYKMREGKFLFKGDCQEMFHQVVIREEDRDALRFLFQFTGEALKVYQMDRMVFGVVCSPSTSQFVVQKIANEFQNSHPEAAQTIKLHLYVDDLVRSVNSIEEGKKLIYEVRTILASGGFKLVKFNATDERLFSLLNEKLSDSEKQEEKLFSREAEEKLLGYVINFQHDMLTISLAMPKIQKILNSVAHIPTKKEVLRITLSFFDPLGTFMFFVSKLKLIYHWVCDEKIDWDDKIPEKLMNFWTKALQYIPMLENISIPRCYSERITESTSNQMWAFVDAGKDMSCVVAFVRFLNEHNECIGHNIIGSKTFTIPSKQKRTIPELELDIVEKGLSFMEKVVESHSITFHELFVATDSSCVFEWITRGVTKPTIYVKNRIKKIVACKLKVEFLWIPTELQTADLGTKWNAMPELTADNDWFTPKIFRLPQSAWPKFLPPQYSGKINNIKGYAMIKRPDSDFLGSFIDTRRYSSMGKAVGKAQSLIFRWLNKTQLKKIENKIADVTQEFASNEISERKFKKALNKLSIEKSTILVRLDDVNHRREIIEINFYKDAQEEFYAEEIEALKAGNEIPRTSTLFKVSPSLGEHGLLRASTRITNNEENRAKFSIDRISPIILPPNHHTTRLVILQAHANNRHVHNDAVIIDLMGKFYIPHIKWTVKSVIKTHCYLCKLKACKPVIPRMGDLPKLRLDSHSPLFTNTIVDVCGPFKVVVGRKSAKRWLFVASCLTTRAVHIEIMHHMTANSAILALNNLIHLRGKPEIVYSDMGTNFIGAFNEMQKSFNERNKTLIDQGMEPLNIVWETSPAKASHMNGAIERLIGLTKNALHKMEAMMNKKLYHLDDESFRAFVCETIGILNNRPLCMTPIEGTTNEFLTPNHFLMSRTNFMSRPIAHNAKLITKYWNDVQNLANILWNHWLKAYIPTIMYREKWIEKCAPLQVGDLVVTADPSVYNSWRLGKIVEIDMGSQQQVRKLKVMLGKNSRFSDDKMLRSPKGLMKAYKNEKVTFVTRPASAVAAINLRADC